MQPCDKFEKKIMLHIILDEINFSCIKKLTYEINFNVHMRHNCAPGYAPNQVVGTQALSLTGVKC